MRRTAGRILKWVLVGMAALVLLMLSPIAYVETLCRGSENGQEFAGRITAPQWKRNEAATWLTYPEWHIVYAYEDMAEILRTADEYAFDYASSIAGFWSSYCRLNRKADEHGGADGATRVMIYTIGISFSVEMALKALYEETVGRLAAALRGIEKTPQDIVALEMADDYARFLHQVPWYKYPFQSAVEKLWDAPIRNSFRGWERRLALGGEWKAKSAYATLIASAVAATTGPAQLEIRTVVSGVPVQDLEAIADVTVVSAGGDAAIVQSPRYRKFTRILGQIFAAGGEVSEIAGNDDVLVSIIVPDAGSVALPVGLVISDLSRQGFEDKRVLLALKTNELALLFRAAGQAGGYDIEHVYDY